jgi:hypothetical protein
VQSPFVAALFVARYGAISKKQDPACGSADFLTAAFHKGKANDQNYAECIWGSDNSDAAESN